jgi:hypothetical protein
MSVLTRVRSRIAGKSVSPALAQRAAAASHRSATAPAMMSALDAINTLTGAGQIPREGMYGMRAMPRDPMDLVPFGPMHPLIPAPLDPARPDGSGRPEPRIDEYDVGANLPGSGRPLPWHVLRGASMNVDIIRRCIQLRKKHIRGLRWAWVISDDAIEVAMGAHPRGTASRDDVEYELRQRLQPEIGRLTEFWRKPWKSNNMSFGVWVNALLEDHLALDAVAVYPRMTYGRTVTDLEIISGDTIKPLRDNRGALPVAPHPAYQQELYGFPRGEFTPTLERTAQGIVVPNAYIGDQLYYHRENPRPKGSPYGLPPVEQALVSARLYLRRQGWMLSEYDDGVIPRAWLVPDYNGEQLTLLQRRQWQADLNDELAGNTAARQRVVIPPKGFKPVLPSSLESQYKPDYDLHLIKMVAGFFDLMSSELGFQEPGGLGSTGFHEGQEDIQYRIGTRPTTEALQEIIVELSQAFLNAPSELTFRFLGLESEDEAAQDEVAQNRVQSGRLTINEDRDRQGKPRYAFKEADMPQLQTARGVVFLEGASETAPPGMLIEPAQAPPGSGGPEAGAAPGSASPEEDTPGAPPASDNPGQPAQPAPTRSAGASSDAAPTTGKGPKAPKPGKPAKAGKGKPAKASAAAKGATVDQVLSGAEAAHAVFDQLLADYPRSALGWVLKADWRGPVEVPLRQIDFSNADTWRAAHEPEKVARFEKRIKRGKQSPIILVRTPHGEQDIVVDGHHRSSAFRNLGRPALAWVGQVHAEIGPWDTLHNQQLTSPSGPEPKHPTEDEDTRASHKAISPEGWAEASTYQRWLAKGGAAAHERAFRFEHLLTDQALDAGIVAPDAVGVTAVFGKDADPGPKAGAGDGPATASM